MQCSEACIFARCPSASFSLFRMREEKPRCRGGEESLTMHRAFERSSTSPWLWLMMAGIVLGAAIGIWQSQSLFSWYHRTIGDWDHASMRKHSFVDSIPPMNITIGVVANEFFDPSLGRTGGFGMATNMLGKFFPKWPQLGVSVVFIFASPEQGKRNSNLLSEVNHTLLGWPLISMVQDRQKAARAVWQAAIDVLLLIDYRDDYRKVIDELPGTPLILWARDPRTKQQIQNLGGIRLPRSMQFDKRPQGVGAPLATGAARVFEKLEGPNGANSRAGNLRKFVVATTWMPALRDRVWEAYQIPPAGNTFELPNIVEGCLRESLPKSRTPSVIFMGRLDPYKRPWLLVELAKRFPAVEFWVFGRRHFQGTGSYDITQDSGPLPQNIKLFGQVTGREKWVHFQKAWFLVSTSAHEGLAVNYLEALQCRTPVLSTVDPGGIVSSYGIFAGEFSGSGEQGLPALQKGFEELVEDKALRRRLGDAGRQHVLETHSEERFLEGFQRIIGQLDLKSGSSRTTFIQPTLSSYPASVIIPSFSRMDTLPSLLAHVLSLDSMRNSESEILIVHASEESWQQRARIHTDTSRILVSKHMRSSYEASKLIHVNGVALNDKWGCTTRHFAALEARNNMLVHLDDDLIPPDEVLAKMIQYVRNEVGYPNYKSESSAPHFYGSTLRYCGPRGYSYEYVSINDIPESGRFILTNFVSMSSFLNQQFVSAFQENEFYQYAMGRFKGNGCDLIFNHFARNNRRSVGVFDTTLSYDTVDVSGYKGVYGGSTHYLVRDETCRCLSTNFTIGCLEKIPKGEDPK